MQTRQELAERQQKLLLEMGQIQVMRRGTLSPQVYPERRKRKEGTGKEGPYFVWQGSLKGKHFSVRVRAEEAPRFADEIAQRRKFEALAAEYIALGQRLAELPGAPALGEEVKKKPSSRRNRTRK
ncbi:MAG: hypothetical protein HYV26_19710 [Candidatus Hydrogenedentes bacterium]|nr:hypothetical protein [Candidatus Hydrogenedentota bacterium]